MKTHRLEAPITLLDRRSTLMIFGICLLLVGFPLHWLPSDQINPDSYLHVALANYYLFSNEGGVRDALTSGPVIPFLYTLFKGAGMLIFTWTPRADVVLIKLFSFFCYFMIALGSARLIVEKAGVRSAVLSIAFILGFMGTGMDLLSPNGELVSAAFLIWLLVLLRARRDDMIWHVGVVLLSLIILATKIQAAPLLALVLCGDARIWRNWKRLLAVALPLFLLVELSFFMNGAGIAHNLPTLLRYVMEGAVANDKAPTNGANVYEMLRIAGGHSGWIARAVLDNFPIFFMIVFGLVCAPVETPRPIIGHWLVWMTVTLGIIFAPGRPFPHYVILALPFVARFTGDVLMRFSGSRLQISKPALALTILGLFVYKSLPALPDRLNPDPDNGTLIGGYKVRHDLRGIPAILAARPGSVFVNGWDYRVHSYLGLPSVRGELPWFMAGALTSSEYVKGIVDRRFDYVLDITGRTGLIAGPDHSLSGPGPLGRMAKETYSLIYDSNGLRLFQINEDR